MLRIENVYKSYDENHVLKGVSFNVKNNEIKGLIGINGAGKSTLIELVCGIKKIDDGKIFVSNNDVDDKKNKNELKSIIGYMPQSFNLFNDLTVEENLGYLCAVYNLDENVAINKILDLCNLNDKRKVLSSHLSGGYRQLLSLAGTLIHNPQLIILDEPTSAMDPLFRKSFWKIIKECKNRGCTILVITHYMEELLECDSFVCLSNGRIVVDDTLENYKHLGELDIEKILETYIKE